MNERQHPEGTVPCVGTRLEVIRPELPIVMKHDAAFSQRLASHMVECIESSPLLREPFPHFVARGFLPEDVYSQVLAHLPDVQHYKDFAYEKHQTDGMSNRKRFCMVSATLDALPPLARRLWYSLRHAFGSRELKDAVYRKLAPGLSLRYGIDPRKVTQLEGFALPELFRETKGYSIAPHPDTRKKVVTMQFSIARDDSQEALGTEFYRRSLNPRAWLREPRGFDTIKTMPFLPNTVYAFSVLNTLTLKSWHGRTAIAGASGVRNTLLNIWYEKVENANPELAEECGLIGPQARAA